MDTIVLLLAEVEVVVWVPPDVSLDAVVGIEVVVAAVVLPEDLIKMKIR